VYIGPAVGEINMSCSMARSGQSLY
jgi:hypothetical protein